MYKSVSISAFDAIPDPRVDTRLLPSPLVQQDNSRKIRHYKIALRYAIKNCLTPIQRRRLLLHYQSGLRNGEIARRENSSCAAVSKSIKASEKALQEYVSLYMEIYQHLEQEFLRESEK